MKQEYALLSVPAEVLAAAEIYEGDTIQIHMEGKRIIIENLDDLSGFACNGDCGSCLMEGMGCDGECTECPCRGHCSKREG